MELITSDRLYIVNYIQIKKKVIFHLRAEIAPGQSKSNGETGMSNTQRTRTPFTAKGALVDIDNLVDLGHQSSSGLDDP